MKTHNGLRLKLQRYFFIIALCLTSGLLFSSSGWAARKTARKSYAVTAKSAIFSNSSQANRFYGKNVHTKVEPASTTKVMTALMVLENLPLDKVVVVSRQALNVQPTKVGLLEGEHYRISDLLYASLMQSANDASIVLAEAVAGSEKEFVKLMNKRAKQLGAHHTKFANPHGLPTQEPQYTTAYDMYLIFREALKYPFFRETLTHKNKIIVSQEGRQIPVRSYNKLLWKNWKKNIYGKTGYTKKARYCFVGYLEEGKDTFIMAVFGCRKRWSDIRYIVTTYGGINL